MSSNTSAQTDTQVACVYALSGAYGTLPRFLYYATLVLAIFGRSKEWLVIGALVSSLAYAATTAIHVMALITSKVEVFDLDAIGAWAILSTAALAYVAMIHWSSTLRNSDARVVMIVWGMLVGMALLFNRSVLFDTPYSNFENACYAADGMMLTTQLDLIKPDFNCTYSCFHIRKPMRGTNEIIAVPASVIQNKYSNLSYVIVGPVMFAAYVAISWDARKHSPPQMCTYFVLKHLKSRDKEDLMKLIYSTSTESWYGGYFVLFHYMTRIPWCWQKVVLYLLAYPWLFLSLILDVLCLPLLVLNVVLNELHLLASGIPVSESMYNVGQWSPIVNSVLIMIAAVIQRGIQWWEKREKRRKRLPPPRSEFELHRVVTDATLVEEVHLGA